MVYGYFELEAEVVNEWRIQLAHQCLRVFQSTILAGMVVLGLFLQVVPSKVSVSEPYPSLKLSCFLNHRFLDQNGII